MTDVCKGESPTDASGRAFPSLRSQISHRPERLDRVQLEHWNRHPSGREARAEPKAGRVDPADVVEVRAQKGRGRRRWPGNERGRLRHPSRRPISSGITSRPDLILDRATPKSTRRVDESVGKLDGVPDSRTGNGPVPAPRRSETVATSITTPITCANSVDISRDRPAYCFTLPSLTTVARIDAHDRPTGLAQRPNPAFAQAGFSKLTFRSPTGHRPGRVRGRPSLLDPGGFFSRLPKAIPPVLPPSPAARVGRVRAVLTRRPGTREDLLGPRSARRHPQCSDSNRGP